MDGLSLGIVTLASQNAQAATQREVAIAVLKKALDSEKALAASLLGALQSPPALASEGPLGTQLNVRA